MKLLFVTYISQKYAKQINLNYTFYIAKRITLQSKRKFSKLIVRIAIAGIALGVMVMLLSVGVIRGFKETIKDKLTGFSGDLQVSNFQYSQNSNDYLIRNSDFENALKKNNQIQQVLQVANKVTIMQHNNRIEPLMIKGVNNMNDYQFMIENIVKGRRANADNEILISKYIADKHSIDTADRILFYFTDQPVKLRKYKVVGVYESSIDQIDQNIVLANIDLVKSVNDWTNNQIAYYQIHLKDRTKLNEELLVQLDQYIPLDQKVFTNQEIYSELYDWINLLDVNSQVIIILMLIVAGINMISAILILILERVAFIGVLKTMGASNAFVKRVFYYNASYLIFIGLLIGNSLTLITYYLQKKFHLIELDPSSYYMKYVEIHFKPLDFVLMNTGVFISTLFFVWLGTLLITKINPLKAIRFN